MVLFQEKGCLKEFNDYYLNHPIDFLQYDTIEMPEFEIENLFKGRSNDELLKELDVKYIYEPSLQEFTLKILDVDGSQKGRVLFKKTCMPIPFEESDLVLKNALYVFMYDYLNDEPSYKMIIGYGFSKNYLENHATFSYEIPIGINEFILFSLDGAELEYSVDRKKMKFLYMLLQEVFYNRPTVFIETARREIPIGVKIKKTKKQILKKRVVKVVKVLQLNSTDYGEYLGKRRVITCPSWGVIGHIRTLKSGKQIWIKPYRKGKERNNPKIYSAKQYELEKKVNV